MANYRKLLGLYSILCFLWANPAAASADEREFTSHELQLLNTGKIVKRPTTQTRGGLHLFGGTSWQVINARPEYVWNVITDVRKYRYIFPHVTSAHLLWKKGNRRIVQFEHAKGPFNITYALKGTLDDAQRDLTFELDTTRPRDIRAGWGFMTVRPFGDDKAILAYGMMLDVGSGVIKGLLRDKIQETVLHVPREVKKYIHRKRKRSS